jgi:hypothetical protein
MTFAVSLATQTMIKPRTKSLLEETMIMRRLLQTAFILGVLAPHSALALDWEIERNFRYFLYPSDVAIQRLARDLYVAEKGTSPTPEQLEKLMNGGGFWKTKLGEAGDLRKRWPIDWPRVGLRPRRLWSNASLLGAVANPSRLYGP